MSDAERCEACGGPLSAGVLGGYCPSCLIGLGMESEPGLSGATPSVSSETPQRELPIPLASTPPPSLMERGTRLGSGRYEILQVLGQGGMGAVYKAKDHELDRWVAIKVIQPELGNSPAILRRFKLELILARQVTHRNVVRIVDIGETDGMKFITMECVDGGDLKSAIIERGKMPAKEAADIIRQICYALDAAHSEGVVHRDLKPQNIMIASGQKSQTTLKRFGFRSYNLLALLLF